MHITIGRPHKYGPMQIVLAAFVVKAQVDDGHVKVSSDQAIEFSNKFIGVLHACNGISLNCKTPRDTCRAGRCAGH